MAISLYGLLPLLLPISEKLRYQKSAEEDHDKACPDRFDDESVIEWLIQTGIPHNAGRRDVVDVPSPAEQELNDQRHQGSSRDKSASQLRSFAFAMY